MGNGKNTNSAASHERPQSQAVLFQSSLTVSSYSGHKDVPLAVPAGKGLVFEFNLDLADPAQDFCIYYQVQFDSGKLFWIGFKSKHEGTGDYAVDSENTRRYDFDTCSVRLSERVQDTLAGRNIGHFGKPVRITCVRARGSRKISKDIKVHFRFYNEE